MDIYEHVLTFAELPGLIKDIKEMKEHNRQIRKMRKTQSKTQIFCYRFFSKVSTPLVLV